jgi:hypothetical protein
MDPAAPAILWATAEPTVPAVPTDPAEPQNVPQLPAVPAEPQLWKAAPDEVAPPPPSAVLLAETAVPAAPVWTEPVVPTVPMQLQKLAVVAMVPRVPKLIAPASCGVDPTQNPRELKSPMVAWAPRAAPMLHAKLPVVGAWQTVVATTHGVEQGRQDQGRPLASEAC